MRLYLSCTQLFLLVMIRLILGFLFLSVSCFSFGQMNKNCCDSLLKKAIQKQIAFPYSNNIIDSSGATLIKVSKSGDSLYIDILFTSSNQYSLENDMGIRHRLNKYKEKFPDQYLVYVPIYFDFYLEGNHKIPLNNIFEAQLEGCIKMLGNNVDILKPVMIEGYQTVR
jgi:hypothetical protein